ncbi:MAG: citrate synthase [Candidatus Omnitrophota bacterium]
MPEKAKLILDGQTYELPTVVGTEGEKAVDITNLRKESGFITLDSGFANTGACASEITFLDGEKGVLRYYGYPIEDIAEKVTFVEASYLLIYGNLPTQEELNRFSALFTRFAKINEGMKNFFYGYPPTGHPMAILSAMVCSLSLYYPELGKEEPTKAEMDLIFAELLSKVRTIAAYAYKKSIGEKFIEPRDDLRYIPNFLHMMFSKPGKDYKIDEYIVRTLQTLLILHADHEQNCSTSTVRLVGSSGANLFASVAAGISALWGPLHGGANQKVVEMLEQIYSDGGHIQKYIDKAKDPNSHYRLMGFGHRVYKNYDPRARLIKQRTHDLLHRMGIHDPLLDLAVKLEEAVLKDEYFVQRKLYPNVDFYSGLIYKAIGIPTNMFPVMFAIGRLPGWIAHWKEMKQDPKTRIGRPRQVYIGKNKREYVPIDDRK